MSNTPRTPPRRGFASQLWTPATPRYAPMDEPDRSDMIKHRLRHSPRKGRVNSVSKTLDNSKSHLPQSDISSITLPLTPEQTPINRKKRDLDLILRATTSQGPSGRILFPTSSPAKGTGRQYKRQTETQCGPKQEHKRKSLDTCPSTSHFSPARSHPEKHEPESESIHLPDLDTSKRKVLITTSPVPSKLEIFDDTKALRAEIDGDPFTGPPRGTRRKAGLELGPPSKKHAVVSTLNHPHDTSIDPSVPGMWYNFRGKKVFRPFPGGVAPLDGYEPKVLFGPRRDSKSLEMSTTPISRKKQGYSEDGASDFPGTPSRPTDPFTARLMQSVSKTQERPRATTPEIDSDEEDSTDREDQGDEQQLVTATTTTTRIERRQFAHPISRTPRETRFSTPKKHFFR